jgi:hypothetical protein
MAILMSTTELGTSVGQIVVGMRKLGIHGRKVVVGAAADLTPPAMLFVDHEATGPESHAVALMSNSEGVLHVVDPLVGSLRIAPSVLKKTWTGRAIEFRLREPGPRGDNPAFNVRSR